MPSLVCIPIGVLNVLSTANGSVEKNWAKLKWGKGKAKNLVGDDLIKILVNLVSILLSPAAGELST